MWRPAKIERHLSAAVIASPWSLDAAPRQTPPRPATACHGACHGAVTASRFFCLKLWRSLMSRLSWKSKRSVIWGASALACFFWRNFAYDVINLKLAKLVAWLTGDSYQTYVYGGLSEYTLEYTVTEHVSLKTNILVTLYICFGYELKHLFQLFIDISITVSSSRRYFRRLCI